MCCMAGEAVTAEAAAVEQSVLVVHCMAGEAVTVVWCTNWMAEHQYTWLRDFVGVG